MKKIEKEQSSDLIVQHNDLIGARQQLTLQEKRIFLWLGSKVNVDDEDFKEHELSIKEFCDLVGVDCNGMYNRLAKITKGLMEKVIEIKTIDGSREVLEQVNLLSYARYEKGLGIVVLSFHPRMGRLLLNLQNNFTKTSLSISLKFSSFYALRFYELMKQNMFSRVSIPSISELKVFFGIKPWQYKNYKDFKKYVIKPAIDEVNEKSDFDVDWSEIKRGRKVELIRFSIKEKKSNHERAKPFYTDEVIESECFITRHSLDQLRKEFSEKSLQQGLEVLKKYKDKKKLKNPVLFLRRAIQEGWQPFEDKKQEEQSKELFDETHRAISLLDEEQICIQIRKLFLEKEGEAKYKSWIKPLKFKIEDGSVVVVTKNKFTQDWLEANYAKQFSDYADGRKIIFQIKEKEDKPKIVNEVIQSLENKKTKRSEPNVAVKKITKKTKTKQESPVKRKTLWQKIKSFWR